MAANSSPFYGLTSVLAREETEDDAGVLRAPKRWWRRGGADLVRSLLASLRVAHGIIGLLAKSDSIIRAQGGGLLRRERAP
jgi:hypothetical protein